MFRSTSRIGHLSVDDGSHRHCCCQRVRYARTLRGDRIASHYVAVAMSPQYAMAPSFADAKSPAIWTRLRHGLIDPEARLVFSLARTQGPSEDFGDSLRSIANWHRLLQLASEENALIALRTAVRHERGVPPASVERQLAVLALDREFRMRQLQNRLEELLLALNRSRIDVLLLKGSALASTVYGSFIARPMRDIDLLVRPQQAHKARALMLGLGWTVDPELPGDRSYGTHHHLPPLRDASASGLRLEIHRSILPHGHPFRFTENEIWNAARPATVGAGRAFVMHPSHHTVHIAIHFAWSHMLKFGAWNAIRDLDALSGADLLDWNDVVATAERWGASSCCYWTLTLARILSDLVTPDAITRALRPGLLEIVRRSLARHFVNGVARTGLVCPSARLDRALWSLAMQPTREGHGDVRPWLVSLDLLFAFREKAREIEEASESSFLLMRRSSRYISALFA